MMTRHVAHLTVACLASGVVALAGCSASSSDVVVSDPVVETVAPEHADAQAIESVAAQQPVPEPAVARTVETAPSPASDGPGSDVEMYRPSWWVDGSEDVSAVSSFADHANLREATRRAAAEGIRMFEERGLSGERLTRTESIRLPDGRYRAFFFASVEQE